jgi:Branched-chain amino acid transport protein (AzlD)
MAMNGYEGLWGYLVLIMVGFLPADIWRLLGVIIGRGLDEESELLVWVRAVATAVLAGVIAKIVFFPPGALATLPLAVRLAAIGCGFSAFLLARRSVFAGLVTGEAVLLTAGFVLSR